MRKRYCTYSYPPGRVKNRRKITDRKYLSITSLQTDYLNLGRSSGSGRNKERENIVQKKCTFCGGTNHFEDKYFKMMRKDKEKLVRLVIRTDNGLNVNLENVLDVDLRII